MTQRELKVFRDKQLRLATASLGVYALCEFDRTPIYIGQTVSTGERGIAGRARRHITSARSDTIANRQIDVWEIAFLWTWPVRSIENVARKIAELEADLFNFYNRRSPLLNGKILTPRDRSGKFDPPPHAEIQLIPDAEIERRRDPRNRLLRQIQQINQLLDWVLNVKDTTDLRRTLRAHFSRATRHYDSFMASDAPEAGDAEDQD